jgi:GH15 family glucan-1,4-alpha-glucosidase
MPREYKPIENYGVIGNLQTVALVGIDASIDFLCFPYFDSPSIFASLLDVERGGHFSLSPVLQSRRPKQIYLLNSNILLTRFLSPDGVAEVSDYMPISLESQEERYDRVHQLIRRAKCVRGEVKFQMICEPQFDYGRAKHQVKLLSEQEAVFIPESGESAISPIRLRAQTPLVIREGRLESEFVLRAGESVFFNLSVRQVRRAHQLRSLAPAGAVN